MRGTEQFQSTIKAYLDNRAKNDELFANTYKKEGKTIKGCIEYILSEVQKSKRNGFADQEIYSMAVHYYDEDDLQVEKVSNMRVVVNHAIDEPKKNTVIEKPIAKVKKAPIKPNSETGIIQGTLF